MGQVGIWERDGHIRDGLAQGLARWGAAGRYTLISACHPGELAGRGGLELLVVAPEARGWAGAGALRCRTVLLPGRSGPLAHVMKADGAVSYGTGDRDTLTLSGLEGGRLHLAIQRELITSEGGVVERQEFPLRRLPDQDPLLLLAVTGGLLLLGVPPEALRE